MEGPRKVTQRTLQAEATKEKIIKATIELMKTIGLNNMTIKDIHHKAGISVGTFYHYYKTKEEVFFELYRIADDYFKQVVVPKLNRKELAVTEKILLFFKHYALFNEANGLEYVKQLYSTSNKMFTAKGRYMIAILQELVVAGQASGEFSSSIGAEEITNYLLIFGRGLVFDWCIREGSYSLTEKIVWDMGILLPVFRQ